MKIEIRFNTITAEQTIVGRAYKHNEAIIVRFSPHQYHLSDKVCEDVIHFIRLDTFTSFLLYRWEDLDELPLVSVEFNGV